MDFVSILKVAKDNWKVIAWAGVAIALVIYVSALRIEIATKDSDIASLKADVATLRQNNATLDAALGTQNAAIGKISELSAQTKKGFEALGINVNNQTTTLNTRLAEILKDKKPITCEDTIKYLIDASKGYK